MILERKAWERAVYGDDFRSLWGGCIGHIMTQIVFPCCMTVIIALIGQYESLPVLCCLNRPPESTEVKGTTTNKME